MRGNPNPTCGKECRFTFGQEFQTAAYYPPVYDKNGNIVSTDGNITSGACDCLTCGKHWTYIARYGVPKFEEWPDHGNKTSQSNKA